MAYLFSRVDRYIDNKGSVQSNLRAAGKLITAVLFHSQLSKLHSVAKAFAPEFLKHAHNDIMESWLRFETHDVSLCIALLGAGFLITLYLHSVQSCSKICFRALTNIFQSGFRRYVQRERESDRNTSSASYKNDIIIQLDNIAE